VLKGALAVAVIALAAGPLAAGPLAAPAVAAPAVAAPPITNTNDSGPGSLRNALTNASNGDTVSIPTGTYVLTTGPIQLSTNLTIVGDGEGRTTVSGGGAQQIFTTTPGGPTEIFRALTLTEGNAATLGGAVLATGRLTLDHVEVTHSHAGQAGGAVNASGRALTVTGSTFTADTAGGGGNVGSGGAIFFGSSTSTTGDSSTMKIDSSSFSQDTAGGAGGSGFGGAIDFAPAATGSATDVSLDAELTASTFSNDAAGGGGGAGFGGALFLDPSDSSTNVDDTFTAALTDDDLSGDAASPSGSGAGVGGGASIFLGAAGAHDASSLSITSSRFSGDTSSAATTGFGGGLSAVIAGGIVRGSIAASTFSQDGAGTGMSGFGGGLYLTLDSGVTGNVSLTNDTLAANQSGGSGGGAGLSVTSPAAIALINDTIAGNDAGGAGHGGGLSVSGPVAVTNSIVAGNAGANGADCGGAPTSGGGNIESAAGCGFVAAGDQHNAAADLGPLQDNGGVALPSGARLQTLAPLRGSPGIGSALRAACPATDERGISRPQGTGCDAGAFEVTPPAVTTGAAVETAATSADVSGSVIPGDAATSWSVQYGTTTAYGAASPPQTVAPGATMLAVQAPLMDLAPGTTYHYRLVADDGTDQTTGADQTFTTAKPVQAPPQTGGAPRLPGTIRLRSSTARVEGGTALLPLSCSAAGVDCSGTARIVVRRTRTVTRHGHRHHIAVSATLGRVTFIVAAGAQATVFVHVGKLSRRTPALLFIGRSDGGRPSSHGLVLTPPVPRRHR
jgi:hypothetical protein